MSLRGKEVVTLSRILAATFDDDREIRLLVNDFEDGWRGSIDYHQRPVLVWKDVLDLANNRGCLVHLVTTRRLRDLENIKVLRGPQSDTQPVIRSTNPERKHTMPTDELLTSQEQKTLRSLLARHFDDPDTWRLVVQDAGLLVRRIKTEKGMEVVLDNTLAEALRGGWPQLRGLLEECAGRAVALRDHPLVLRFLEGHVLEHIRAKDHILRVNFQGTLSPPTGAETWDQVRCARQVEVAVPGDTTFSSRLRRSILDVDAWNLALTLVQKGVREMLGGLQGRLHVFASAPHAIGYWTGRCIDLEGRQVPLLVHQFDVKQQKWLPFALPEPASADDEAAFFGPLELVDDIETGRGIVLTVDVPQSATDAQLELMRKMSGARWTYRIAPVGPRIMLSPATRAIREVCERLGKVPRRHPGEPIHLCTSAPLALVVMMGRHLRDSVFANVTVYHFDRDAGGYYPVLDGHEGTPISPLDDVRGR